MIPQSGAKIFLSAERGHTETEWFRSYNTFNFGPYQNEDKKPFGPLYVFNDDTLAGSKSFKLPVEKDGDIILIPVVGAVTFKDDDRSELIEVGQAQRFPVLKNTTVEIGNPYENELVTFVHLWIQQSLITSSAYQLSSFDLEKNLNRLVPLFPPQGTLAHGGYSSYLGKFNGRKEAVFKMAKYGRGLFVFVVEGAFEVQYRLLESKDALALWNEEHIEIEALSNGAIILLVELPFMP